MIDYMVVINDNGHASVCISASNLPTEFRMSLDRAEQIRDRHNEMEEERIITFLKNVFDVDVKRGEYYE